MFRITTESQNSPIHTKAVHVPGDTREPLSSRNSASSTTAFSLLASYPVFPVSKATAEPRRWMHKGGNRDPITFSCLSMISHCLTKNHKCTNVKAAQAYKMSAYGFILTYLWWVMSYIAQACISETTWLSESFCWYWNEQALFISLAFAFYLVTTILPLDKVCLSSPLKPDA